MLPSLQWGKTLHPNSQFQCPWVSLIKPTSRCKAHASSYWSLMVPTAGVGPIGVWSQVSDFGFAWPGSCEPIQHSIAEKKSNITCCKPLNYTIETLDIYKEIFDHFLLSHGEKPDNQALATKANHQAPGWGLSFYFIFLSPMAFFFFFIFFSLLKENAQWILLLYFFLIFICKGLFESLMID